jgi:hypothetical protein
VVDYSFEINSEHENNKNNKDSVTFINTIFILLNIEFIFYNIISKTNSTKIVHLCIELLYIIS